MDAPEHLSDVARQWWSDVADSDETKFTNPVFATLLTTAAEAFDRYVSARDKLNADGLTFTDRFNQPKARPEATIERDARSAFASLCKQLQIDVKAAEEQLPQLASRKRAS